MDVKIFLPLTLLWLCATLQLNWKGKGWLVTQYLVPTQEYIIINVIYPFYPSVGTYLHAFPQIKYEYHCLGDWLLNIS